MMNKRKFHLIQVLALSLLMTRCSNPIESEYLINENSQRISLEVSDSIQLNELVARPMQVYWLDNLLIVNEFNNDRLLSLWNLSTGEYIKTLVEPGKGPNEFLPPLVVQIDPTTGKVDVFSRRDLSFKKYYLDDNLNFNESSDRINFSGGSKMIYSLKESLFLGSGEFEEGRFAIFNSRGEISSLNVTEYPDIKINGKITELNAREQATVFQSELAIKPDGSKFVAGHRLLGILELFEIDYSAMSIKKTGEKRSVDEVEVLISRSESVQVARISDDHPRGFLRVYPTEDWIYALYSGKGRSDYPETSHLSNTIHVFDWELNHIKTLLLNEEVGFFTLGNSDKKLLTVDEEKNEAVIYDLP